MIPPIRTNPVAIRPAINPAPAKTPPRPNPPRANQTPAATRPPHLPSPRPPKETPSTKSTPTDSSPKSSAKTSSSYSMILQGDVLLVGTGDDGDLYQVRPGAQETEVLAKVDAKQITCLLPVKDGRIFLGLANTGGISAMTGGYATDGTYLSPVLDATQVSRFGKMQLHGFLPSGTKLQVATRSGNVKDADEPGWSDWSAAADAAEFQPVTSPLARFLQYRLTFKTTDPAPVRGSSITSTSPTRFPTWRPIVKSIRIGPDTTQTETRPTQRI